MQADARAMRGGRPFFFAQLKHGEGVDAVVQALLDISGLALETAAE